MDLFFQELQSEDAFWYDLVPLNQSAFLPYTSTPTREIPATCSFNGSNSTNMNKRMIGFMGRSWPVRIETEESDSARCYRRKISERMRREKEKNGYLALHAMLPLGTRNDKNSIMQMAAKRIDELKRYKEVLERRNYELEEKGGNARSRKIEFKVRNPTSGIDYMVEVLKCLNSLGSKLISIKSRYSDEELVAVMDIETQISDAEMGKAVQTTLQNVQRKHSKETSAAFCLKLTLTT
ncbi:transcription factor bHLH92 [Manihot esculenta]|uniref:BHLH domain-containing protein n=1 Tax=Manihot esculenta TaxID=3983 RepID=A0A2C9W853_MANES|nr:transcription factor bHLH92 [Manihot esculenta]OAY55642.1 hypothetical protein MANES_03G169100v8 [Manihot esculenta]